MSRHFDIGVRFSLACLATCSLSGLMTVGLSACSDDSAQNAVNQLSNPNSIVLSGSGTSVVDGTNYIFATSSGTIDTSTNTVTASFLDGYLPLSLNSSNVFSETMYSGSCASLATLVASVAGGSGSLVTTQMSATGCTDQSVINLNLDTTQIYDNDGFDGEDIATIQTTVDLAPVVSTAATGNTAADGTGTTEGTVGYFSISGDNSIVVTFSKSLTSGTWTGVLSGCAATLGTPTIVANSNGKTVEWPLTGFSGFSAGATCTLSVAGVSDLAGNADDPSDTNQSMTITFH